MDVPVERWHLKLSFSFDDFNLLAYMYATAGLAKHIA